MDGIQIAVGRRIHQYKEAFQAVGTWRVISRAVLGANIDCGVAREGSRPEDRSKLVTAGAAEEHGVPDERALGSLRIERPDHCGKRTFATRDFTGRWCCSPAQKTGSKRSWIPIEKDSIRVQSLAIGQDNARRVSVTNFDLCDTAVEAEARAAGASQGVQDLRDAVHAAPNRPYARGFGVPDQQQCCGRQEGRTADIGGIAPEKLLQAHIAKLTSEGTPERR